MFWSCVISSRKLLGVGPYPPKPAHTIVGAGDEHRIFNPPGAQPPQPRGGGPLSQKYSQRPPKFSAIVNEYVGACMEDHCNIGKHLFVLIYTLLTRGKFFEI